VLRFLGRLRREDAGFTLVETVVALLILFVLLLALETAATAGFRYVGYARERQAGGQIANQVMEEIRGLAYSKITSGLDIGSLATDPNLVTGCPSDPVGYYRFLSCSGEHVISYTPTGNVVPLVPNNGTCPGSPLPLCSAASYPVTYTWRTYVTNDDTARSPFRVTVVVSWTSKSIPSTATQQVKVQSLFWSPSGCVSSSTHPFAAPCSPFFYGQALYPQGRVDVAANSPIGVSGTTFQTGSLLLTKAESDLQQEQVSQVQGSGSESGWSVTDGTGPHAGGSVGSPSVLAADGDPASSAPPYTTYSLPAGTASQYAMSGGVNTMTFAGAAGDSGTINVTTSASGTYICPPWATELDLLPCGGSSVQQAGALSATASIHSISNPDVGDVTLLQVAAPAAASTTLADRDTGGTDGITQQTVARKIGQMDIGQLPAWIRSNCSIPTGFTYFVSLQGYSDTVQATAGSSAAAPTATINAGSLKYWTGTNAAATQTTVTLATTPGYTIPASWSSSIGCKASGKTVTASMAVTGVVSMASQPTTSSTPSGSGSILRNDVTATIGSPVYGTFTYTIVAQEETVVNLSFTVDLGTISSRAVYRAAPTAG
jgi:type II secretory pathway pseudopilin PulG